MRNDPKRLRPWEAAALLTLCLALCWGAWAQSRGEALSGGLVRLHVLAVSDEPEEQALKLRVRDAVLAYLEPELRELGSAGEARQRLKALLPEIRRAAESAAEGRAVRVSLGREDYPTREYGGFRLPAGRYESLRVVLGEGKGRNWWCVVYPPLCLEAESGEELAAALDEESWAIVCREEGYELRFRALELWGLLRQKLGHTRLQ